MRRLLTPSSVDRIFVRNQLTFRADLSCHLPATTVMLGSPDKTIHPFAITVVTTFALIWPLTHDSLAQPPVPEGIWMDRAELAALPTSGEWGAGECVRIRGQLRWLVGVQHHVEEAAPDRCHDLVSECWRARLGVG